MSTLRRSALNALILGLLLVLPCTGYSQEYSRSMFKHWSDLDGNHHNTRYDELAAQNITKCRIISIWVCRYTGFVTQNSKLMDIDHIVPLKYAWEHGAEKWTPARREAFANDHDNLLVVLAAANRSKGAKGPDHWLPPNIRFIPTYIDLFTRVCTKYGLACDTESFDSILLEYSGSLNGIAR